MWGLPAGEARFWRSSASRVFVVACPAAETGRAHLRFVPESWRPRARVVAVAELMRQYSRAGLAVATPMTSVRGQLVETIPTGRGGVHAMLVAEAPGRPVEVADLTVQRARAWGAALARLHCTKPVSGCPSLWVTCVAPHRCWPLTGRSPALSHDCRRTWTGCRGMVTASASCTGTSNWTTWPGAVTRPPHTTSTRPADPGSSLTDIAYALRDVQQAPTARIDTPATAAFLTGYRTVRDLPGTDLTWLPLFTAAYAAAWLMRHPVMAEGRDTTAASVDQPKLTAGSWGTQRRRRLRAQLRRSGRPLRW